MADHLVADGGRSSGRGRACRSGAQARRLTWAAEANWKAEGRQFGPVPDHHQPDAAL